MGFVAFEALNCSAAWWQCHGKILEWICKGGAKAKKQVSFEDALWSSCDKLRGTVEPAAV